MVGSKALNAGADMKRPNYSRCSSPDVNSLSCVVVVLRWLLSVYGCLRRAEANYSRLTVIILEADVNVGWISIILVNSVISPDSTGSLPNRLNDDHDDHDDASSSSSSLGLTLVHRRNLSKDFVDLCFVVKNIKRNLCSSFYKFSGLGSQ